MRSSHYAAEPPPSILFPELCDSFPSSVSFALHSLLIFTWIPLPPNSLLGHDSKQKDNPLLLVPPKEKTMTRRERKKEGERERERGRERERERKR